jgi:hypothetical protein
MFLCTYVIIVIPVHMYIHRLATVLSHLTMHLNVERFGFHLYLLPLLLFDN